MAQTPIKVLLVDDDEDDFLLTRDLLAHIKERPYHLDWAATYDAALAALDRAEHDLYLIDYRLGEHNGLELIRAAVDRGCRSPLILLTGQGDHDVDLQAMKAGAADYLVKRHIDAPTLERAIRYALERARTQEQIQAQAELLDNAREAILVHDLAGRIVFWNKGAERLYGWTEAEALGRKAGGLLCGQPAAAGASDEARTLLAAALGLDAGDLVEKPAPPELDEARRAVLERGAWSGELPQATRGGQPILVESHWTLMRSPDGRPRSVLVINIDITERKKLEAQFLRAQRLESIGRLASGVAHDLNNVLGHIMMALEFLKELCPDEEGQRLVGNLWQSAERGANIVKQVLSFARGFEGERILVQPAHVIWDLRNVLKHAAPKTIAVETYVPRDLWPVMGDATQLYQVLMNLAVNALDAMPSGGKLTVSAENVVLDESYASVYREARPGPFVVIKVTDSGEGMPAEVLERAFDPFFTTKGPGKGTGLGLSTALGIVRSHGGFINVYSEVGKGTQFTVYLPACESSQTAKAAQELHNLPPGQGELILLVDDEAAFRQTTQEVLQQHGYRVLAAGDGAEAMRLYQENRGEVKAVVTDLMMPAMDGPATVRQLKRLDPQLRIITTSGLPPAHPETDESNGHVFLQKPYTAATLLQTLHEVLSTAGK